MIDILRIRITTAEFAGLQLTRDPRTGTLSYSVAALTSILESNQIDPAGIIGDEDRVAEILVDWYIAHRRFGGDVNPGIEQVIAEAMAEDEFGADRVQRGSILPQWPGNGEDFYPYDPDEFRIWQVDLKKVLPEGARETGGK